MQERHLNGRQYFQEQIKVATRYVLPYLERAMPVDGKTEILEIGCGEGGNLIPFLNAGCKRMVGIDLSETKIGFGREYCREIAGGDRVEFLARDIYEVDPEGLGRFDFILLRDVIEHIHGQKRFLKFIQAFLKPGGQVLIIFPPWYMPFGGHQQVCESKFLSRCPYFHLFPVPVYRFILKLFGEKEKRINGLLEIRETRISIERLERILSATGYRTNQRSLYFINPAYEVKFGLKPRMAWALVRDFPFVRNFLITSAYYLVSVGEEASRFPIPGETRSEM